MSPLLPGSYWAMMARALGAARDDVKLLTTGRAATRGPATMQQA